MAKRVSAKDTSLFKRLMAAKGTTWRELAEELGMPHTSLWRWWQQKGRKFAQEHEFLHLERMKGKAMEHLVERLDRNSKVTGGKDWTAIAVLKGTGIFTEKRQSVIEGKMSLIEVLHEADSSSKADSDGKGDNGN